MTKIFTRQPYLCLIANVSPVAGRRISDDAGIAALSHWEGPDATAEDEALAVRYTLQLLKQKAPGSSVEVRVPPWGAIQAIDGPTHTRGTPPAVIEMSPTVWLEIALGKHSFDEALGAGRIQASGQRSNLSAWLPIVALP
jgi:hypothetical protein